MSISIRSAILGLVLAMVAACSPRATIDKMVSAEDRAFATAFVNTVRTGDFPALQPQFDPELWQKSVDQLPQARTMFPPQGGETHIIGYETAFNTNNGISTWRKDYTLVTSDGSHWTTTEITTYSEGGPHRVVAWNVVGSATKPEQLETFEWLERAVPWIRAGVVIFVVLVIGAVVWFFRRAKRKRSAQVN